MSIEEFFQRCEEAARELGYDQGALEVLELVEGEAREVRRAREEVPREDPEGDAPVGA